MGNRRNQISSAALTLIVLGALEALAVAETPGSATSGGSSGSTAPVATWLADVCRQDLSAAGFQGKQII
jgi:hypothetical protein